jgi:Mesyanzhinovviridae DNA primase
MSTNDKWVVPASWDERRYAVFEVNPVYMQQREYFELLFAEIDGDGAAAMVYDLLRLDLDGWHPRYNIPQTAALIEQKVQSLDGLEQWWLAKLSTGETPIPGPKNPRHVLSKRLYVEAVTHNARAKYVTDTEFGRFLSEVGCEHKSNGKAWGWVFPPLPEARRAWEIKMGGTYDWLSPDIKEWNEGCVKDLLD